MVVEVEQAFTEEVVEDSREVAGAVEWEGVVGGGGGGGGGGRGGGPPWPRRGGGSHEGRPGPSHESSVHGPFDGIAGRGEGGAGAISRPGAGGAGERREGGAGAISRPGAGG